MKLVKGLLWTGARVICHLLEWATIFLFWYLPGLDVASISRQIAFLFPRPWMFYAFMTFVLYEAAWLLGFLVMYVIYRFDSLFESWKCALNPWPWRRDQSLAKNVEIKQQYQELLRKTVQEYTNNQFSIFFMVTIAFFLTDFSTDWDGFEVKYINRLPPSRWHACAQLLVGVFLFDTVFYWTHFLEHKYIYHWHRVHHEYNNVYLPISVTGTYGHALDGLLGIIFPAFFPSLLLQYDLVTFWQFMMIHTFHSVYDHAGYEMWYSPLQLIPLSGHVEAHIFHHTHNDGNFGLYWRFWDRLMGTDRAYNKYLREGKPTKFE
eukprot:TRINITY_DN2613_c0_g1_i2.p1 TRINITY_DN2613_c0_g1~~TRINITY_DN2613_c0_g1_i2.p1  ORF type:complete len:319 (-),score=39.64 TRINITY_DN2613_c0_g1_i2:19-975(-)